MTTIATLYAQAAQDPAGPAARVLSRLNYLHVSDGATLQVGDINLATAAALANSDNGQDPQPGLPAPWAKLLDAANALNQAEHDLDHARNASILAWRKFQAALDIIQQE